MSKTMKEDKIKINFELSKELFEKLREKASREELTYSAYLRQLIKKATEGCSSQVPAAEKIDVDENGIITGLF